MSGRAPDLTGQGFGRLTVLERAASDPRGYGTTWVCRCACGELTKVPARTLRSGSTTSCGCYQRERSAQVKRERAAHQHTEQLAAMIGRRFHRFVVMAFHDSGPRELRYLCRCDCGAERVVGRQALVEGRRKSCGCLRRERFLREFAGKPKRRTSKYTGHRFGYLTVVRTTRDRNGYSALECRCVCGRTILATSHSLVSGKRHSCGCDPIAASWARLVMERPTPLYERAETGRAP